MNSKEEQNQPGDICTRCTHGRIALMNATVSDATLDDEPYTEGVKEGDNVCVWFDENIELSIHACDYCGYVYSSRIEN